MAPSGRAVCAQWPLLRRLAAFPSSAFRAVLFFQKAPSSCVSASPFLRAHPLFPSSSLLWVVVDSLYKLEEPGRHNTNVHPSKIIKDKEPRKTKHKGRGKLQLQAGRRLFPGSLEVHLRGDGPVPLAWSARRAHTHRLQRTPFRKSDQQSAPVSGTESMRPR